MGSKVLKSQKRAITSLMWGGVRWTKQTLVHKHGNKFSTRDKPWISFISLAPSKPIFEARGEEIGLHHAPSKKQQNYRTKPNLYFIFWEEWEFYLLRNVFSKTLEYVIFKTNRKMFFFFHDLLSLHPSPCSQNFSLYGGDRGPHSFPCA